MQSTTTWKIYFYIRIFSIIFLYPTYIITTAPLLTTSHYFHSLAAFPRGNKKKRARAATKLTNKINKPETPYVLFSPPLPLPLFSHCFFFPSAYVYSWASSERAPRVPPDVFKLQVTSLPRARSLNFDIMAAAAARCNRVISPTNFYISLLLMAFARARGPREWQSTRVREFPSYFFPFFFVKVEQWQGGWVWRCVLARCVVSVIIGDGFCEWFVVTQCILVWPHLCWV